MRGEVPVTSNAPRPREKVRADPNQLYSARAGRRDLLAKDFAACSRKISESMTLVALKVTAQADLSRRSSERRRMADRAGILDPQLAGHARRVARAASCGNIKFSLGSK